MNEPTYQCSQCGNGDAFTELVWEQRRYPIDRRGETTSNSDAVEGTEVPVEVSCDQCGAKVVRFSITPPKEDDQKFWMDSPQYWEDLPANTDCTDEDGIYRSEFIEQFSTAVNDLDVIIDEYWTASKEKRITMNWIFVRLCGYTLPAIVKNAHVQGSDDEKAHNSNPKAR